MINGKMKINPKDKRLARIIAVQVIYAYEIYPENSDNVMSVILDNDDEDWSPLESVPSDNAIAYGKKLYKMVIKIRVKNCYLIQA